MRPQFSIFWRSDWFLTVAFVRYERSDHIFFQNSDVPTAMLDLRKLTTTDHTVNSGRLQFHDLTYLLDCQHRRILLEIAFQRLPDIIVCHKNPPLRRKRKQYSVDVSYSAFKMLLYIVCRLFLCPKIDVLLAAPTLRSRSSRQHISRRSAQPKAECRVSSTAHI